MRAGARRAALVTVGAAGLLLAGCATPEGIDGDLVGAWGVMPEPVGFVPEVGVCHETEYLENASLLDYQPVDCAAPHRTETVHVGVFEGEAAERVSPPEPGTAGWRDAFGQCEDGAAEYLGADFRHGPLWLGVTVPTVTAWEGGARWLRCDVVELDNDEREGSLAGALSGSSDLVLGCFVAEVDADEGWVESLDPVPCTETHDTEFVGVWHSSDSSYPENDSAWQRIHQGCRERVAEFADVPLDDNLPARTGTIAVPMDKADWDNGDRGIRCYLWLDGFEITESLRDAGPEGLPIR